MVLKLLCAQSESSAFVLLAGGIGELVMVAAAAAAVSAE
jgi:hypothetical protein